MTFKSKMLLAKAGLGFALVVSVLGAVASAFIFKNWLLFGVHSFNAGYAAWAIDRIKRLTT